MNPAKQDKEVLLSVLLPVRNEGVNLKIMLKILRALLDAPHEVLVIYDFDGDKSIEATQSLCATYPNLRLVKNNLGPGVPNAIRSGVRNATGKYVLLFAADEIGPILAIDAMLDLMHAGCDFVSCTRYAYGGKRLGGSVLGGIASRLANALFYKFSRCALTDATTGIKMFKRIHFEDLKLSAKPVGWSVAFEMSIRAQLLGWKLGEVPIVSIDRLSGGRSTFRFGPWFVEYLRWFTWGFFQLQKLQAENLKKPMLKIPLNLQKG